jgi:hypothetical protein
MLRTFFRHGGCIGYTPGEFGVKMDAIPWEVTSMQGDPMAEQIRDALREPGLAERRAAVWARLAPHLDEVRSGGGTQRRRRWAGPAIAVAAAVGVCGLSTAAVLYHGHPPAPASVTAVRVPLSLSGVPLDGFALKPQRAHRGFVSPDGNWLLRTRDVVSVDGQTCPLPGDHPAGFYGLYGTTPEGELILMSPVNGALLTVLDPRTGHASPFPLDAGASVAWAAEQSPQGVWAKVEGNQTGAGPGLKTWVTVAGEVVPGTESSGALTGVAWSPDGQTLAITLNDGSTLQILLVRPGAGRPEVVARGAWPATGSAGGPAVEEATPAWSPSGRYLAASSGGLLVVYDAESGRFSRADLPEDGRWAWGPGSDRLCVLVPEGLTTRCEVFHPADPAGPPLTSFHLKGRVADVASTGDGLVVQTAEGQLVAVDERDRQTILAEDAQVVPT